MTTGEVLLLSQQNVNFAGEIYKTNDRSALIFV